LFNCGSAAPAPWGRMDRALLLHHGKLVAGTELSRA
jgi:hypothetical protein